MRLEVVDFCNIIKEQYWKYLYETKYTDEMSQERYVDFPVCCRVSAVLITAYLQDCFSENEYQCFFADHRFMMHGFTMCMCDNSIVDFTDFQFLIDDEIKEKMKQHKYDEKEMLSLIKEYPVIIPFTNGGFAFHDYAKKVDLSVYQLIRRKRSLGITEFEEFLSQNWQIAASKVKYTIG